MSDSVTHKIIPNTDHNLRIVEVEDDMNVYRRISGWLCSYMQEGDNSDPEIISSKPIPVGTHVDDELDSIVFDKSDDSWESMCNSAFGVGVKSMVEYVNSQKRR